MYKGSAGTFRLVQPTYMADPSISQMGKLCVRVLLCQPVSFFFFGKGGLLPASASEEISLFGNYSTGEWKFS